MQITITNAGDLKDPRNRILAIEAATQSICEQVGGDPAEGTMMLLTAAVHVAMKHSGKPIKDTALYMANALGYAIIAADDFFKLRERNPDDIRRQEAEIGRLRADYDALFAERGRLREAVLEARTFIAGMVKPVAAGVLTISSHNPCHALLDKIDAALGPIHQQEVDKTC